MGLKQNNNNLIPSHGFLLLKSQLFNCFPCYQTIQTNLIHQSLIPQMFILPEAANHKTAFAHELKILQKSQTMQL